MTPLKKKMFKSISKILAKLFPTKSIKATEYISNVDQTAEQKKKKEQLEQNLELVDDSYLLKEYPLSMVASLLLDTSFMTNGSIKSPFYLVAVPKDEIFPYEYMKDCYKALKAPEKYFVKLDAESHTSLITNPDISIEVLTKIFDKY